MQRFRLVQPKSGLHENTAVCGWRRTRVRNHSRPTIDISPLRAPSQLAAPRSHLDVSLLPAHRDPLALCLPATTARCKAELVIAQGTSLPRLGSVSHESTEPWRRLRLRAARSRLCARGRGAEEPKRRCRCGIEESKPLYVLFKLLGRLIAETAAVSRAV